MLAAQVGVAVGLTYPRRTNTAELQKDTIRCAPSSDEKSSKAPVGHTDSSSGLRAPALSASPHAASLGRPTCRGHIGMELRVTNRRMEGWGFELPLESGIVACSVHGSTHLQTRDQGHHFGMGKGKEKRKLTPSDGLQFEGPSEGVAACSTPCPSLPFGGVANDWSSGWDMRM